MRNVAHFFFSYNGIFGIEEVILQNIWQNTQEKYGISKENVKIANGNGKINAQQGKTLKLRILHKNSKTVYFDKKYLIKTANCKQYAEMI